MIGQRVAAIIALLLALAIAGCSDAPGEPAADSTPANPLVYEIASADGTVEGWMVGTIHALPDKVDHVSTAVRKAVDEADFLVVEIAGLTNQAKNGQILFNLSQSQGLPPLDQRLPSDLRPQLAALLDRAGLGIDDFDTDETWVSALNLARIDAVGNPANGTDRFLINAFSNRSVAELEGFESQLSIFDRLPESAQRTMLAAVVRESDKAGRDPERLLRAWIAGDAATIEAASSEGFLADPTLREALLTGRNRRWTARIVPMLQAAPRPLIAVGTAHLVGPEGLAALLEAEGYRVRRIS